MSEGHKFGCKNCGHPYKVFPPDASHTNPLPEPCEKGDSIEIGYDCTNCNQRNKIHWDKDHFFVASSR